ncbi:hypothetical protein OGAPHI_001559 [Ogataea philodendri]|uniref:Uncharacterized protein n=1 Tax=Ogataea philodendri TaxID=1378263 RepID=A0A9P8T7Q2_9ASCO|nr:uncharacterized protein OGAPHI_001559 [Ogataea philodendri]KAH3669438.1 hypothetical protein OGAPHI_001559 [Ogataea philodendri]
MSKSEPEQVCNLQALDSVNIESCIQDTSLWSQLVALSWSNRAGSQAVPGGLGVLLDVVDNGFVILGSVLDIGEELHLVRGHVQLVLWKGLLDRNGPGSVVQVGAEVVRTSKGLAGLQVQVLGSGWRVHLVLRVVRSDFSCKALHSSGSLSGLLVSPDHWPQVSLVVEETGVEIWTVVRVWRGDSDESSGEWVFQEVEHGHELSVRDLGVVTEESRNHRVMHQWFVWLVGEVVGVTLSEVFVGSSQFLLGWSDLDTGFDTVGGQRTILVGVPLVECVLLGSWVASDEVVKRWNIWLHVVRSEETVVVLEVLTDTRQVDNWLNTNRPQVVSSTNTGSLQNQWRRAGTARNNNLLSCSESSGNRLLWVQRLHWNSAHSNSLSVLDDDLVGLGRGDQEEVVLVSHGWVHISVRRVGSSTQVSVDPLEPVLSTVRGLEVLQVVNDRNSLRFSSSQEVLAVWVCVVTERDLDRTVESVNVFVVARTLVSFEFLHQWQQLVGGPSLGLPVVVVRSRGSGVHQKVDRGATTKNVGAWNNSSSTVQSLGRSGSVESSSLGVKSHVSWVNSWKIHPWVVDVVLTTLDKSNSKIWIKISQSTGNTGAGGSTTNNNNIEFVWNSHFDLR